MPLFVWLASNGGGFERQVWHDQESGAAYPPPVRRYVITDDEATQELDVLAEKYPPPLPDEITS